MTCKAYFTDVAGQWETMRKDFFSTAVRECACNTAVLRPGQRAVDVGAGSGFVTEELVARGLHVVAVDQCANMLAALARRPFAQGVACRLVTGETLPLKDGEVDHAFANMYLHHVEDPRTAIAEMARVVGDGGHVVITDLDLHGHDFLLREHHDRWPGFRRDDVAAWFRAAGLVDVRVADAVVGDKQCTRCCATSACGEDAAITVFVASGVKLKM